MTRTAALDDLMFHYLALYGRGIGKPLGIIEKAGTASHRPMVSGHPLLTLPEVRHIPRNHPDQRKKVARHCNNRSRGRAGRKSGASGGLTARGSNFCACEIIFRTDIFL